MLLVFDREIKQSNTLLVISAAQALHDISVSAFYVIDFRSTVAVSEVQSFCVLFAASISQEYIHSHVARGMFLHLATITSALHWHLYTVADLFSTLWLT